MKKLLLFTFSILLFTSTGFSQDGSRLEALKIAYITKKLDLTPEEAQRFWPVYNQYSAELRKAQVDAYRDKKTEIELDESILNIRKKYSAQFAQVLSPQKVDALFKAEKEFGHFVQKEMERRQLKNQRRLDSANP